MSKINFYGYKKDGNKLSVFRIGGQGIAELWSVGDKDLRRSLVEKMEKQGGLDFIAYEEANNLLYAWMRSCNVDEYGVVVF